MVFGDGVTAERAVARLNGVHRGVSGEIADPEARWATGAGSYRALDPELLLWVQATLVISSVRAYRAWVGSLDAPACERFWQEARGVGTRRASRSTPAPPPGRSSRPGSRRSCDRAVRSWSHRPPGHWRRPSSARRCRTCPVWLWTSRPYQVWRSCLHGSELTSASSGRRTGSAWRERLGQGCAAGSRSCRAPGGPCPGHAPPIGACLTVASAVSAALEPGRSDLDLVDPAPAPDLAGLM